MLALMLLGVSRCASAELCPDDNALISAVRGADDASAHAISAQASEDDPDTLTMVHVERIKGISDVICSEALPGDLPTITCRFTVRYWSWNKYQVARLVKKDGAWEIDEALSVSRKRQ